MIVNERVAAILVRNHLMTQEQVSQVLLSQKQKNGGWLDLVVSSGMVSERRLLGIVGQELSVPCVSLARYKIDSQVIGLIDRKTAEHYQIIPLSLIGTSLTIATSDPFDVVAIHDLKALTGNEVLLILATRAEIQEAIEKYYGAKNQQVISEIVEGMAPQSEFELIQEEKEQETMDGSQLAKISKEDPVVRITNALVVEGAKMQSSDILIEPLDKNLRVRYRIDGVLREVPAPPKYMHQAIVSRIKVMSNLNIAERRIPQDGRFRLRIAKRDVDFRVSILPSVLGERIVLRVLDKSAFTLDIQKLAYDAVTLKKLTDAALRPHGMILVTGPTGSGKTTTLYSLLKYADSPEKNIISVEDPIEYELFGINQVQIRPEVELTFASALRSILRQDPNVILVGEIRDVETAEVAIKAALTGHLVLSTLHTNTAPGSVVRLMNMGVEPFLISSAVILVAAQRLVRKICSHCKEPTQVSRGVLERLGKDFEMNIANVIFYRGKGCEDCRKSGYKGRMAIIEVLLLSPKIKQLIAKRSLEAELKEVAREEGMQTLRENGLEKVRAGLTTIEEIVRVTVGDPI